MVIQEFPNDKYRFEFYINYGKKTWQQIKAETGCYALCNLWYYDMDKYGRAKTNWEVLDSTDCDVILDGNAIHPLQYAEWGLCINDNGELFRATPQGQKNYCQGLPPQYIGGQKYCVNEFVAKNGCTHVGFKANGTPVVCLTPKSEGMTNNEINSNMLNYGCVDILRMDGSFSSQGDLGNGKVCIPNQTRIVQAYLLIYKRNSNQSKGDTMGKKYKVCLDPGHGINELNQSPDGKYFEYKFAWDMSQRIKKLLEDTGKFDVLVTKDSAKECMGLTKRATKANLWGADIFISLHSNAIGAGQWADRTHGLTTWTYAAGGKRDVLANLILEEMAERDVELFGQKLYHSRFTVLAKSSMPAVLIEHLFHTCHSDVDKLLSNEYRDTFAHATAAAVLRYFELDETLLIEDAEEENKVLKDIIYRVQIGAFENEDNAEEMAQSLKAQGYQAIIKENKR